MVHRMSYVLVLVTGTLALFASAPGQGKKFGDAGTAEIAGGVSFSVFTPVSNGKTGDATSLFSFGPEFGYFVANGFEVGFSPGMTILPGISALTPSRGDGTTIMQIFFFPAYNIQTPAGNVTPFLQVPLGYTAISSGNDTDSGFSWGIKGGAKFVAGGQLLVTLYAQYLQISFTAEKATERSGFNYLSFGVSVGGFF
jgi:hypothetical protein